MTETSRNICRQIDEDTLISEEEGFLADVLADIDWLMQKGKISRRELADRLGVTEPRVSRMFSANGRNLTLRTLARIFVALGEPLRLSSPALERLRAEAESATDWQPECDEDIRHTARGIAELWGRAECLKHHPMPAKDIPIAFEDEQNVVRAA